MTTQHVVFPPLIVTRRIANEDRVQVEADARRICIVRADHVATGDLILASFDGLQPDYFNAPYEAEPMPYDRHCTCGVCELLADQPGPVVVLSVTPWGVCDPHPAAAPLLIAPAARQGDTDVCPPPADGVICCAAGLIKPDKDARLGRAGNLLSDHDQAIIRMAARGFRTPGARDRAIREHLGLTPTRYFQLLNGLLDDVRALAHDPVTINRLRRIREENRVKREDPQGS
ncbi:DUF3263 domain-containing protein [Streptomyces sp. NPDC021218]|uniref:DUF3263 domain-containing protein n=1 Tax=Streptomyces sp. NPDC021218 TaxID=3365119 RepID=UPI0037A585AC